MKSYCVKQIKLLIMEEQCFGVLVLNVELKKTRFVSKSGKGLILRKNSPFKGIPILGDII